MKFFEICAEVLVPKFTRAEVRLPDKKCVKSDYLGLSRIIIRYQLVVAHFGSRQLTTRHLLRDYY